MRMLASSALIICVVACALWPASVAAQATIVLAPMTVENYRVLQRVSRNAGWASTAYKNYLVGLFEGLLPAEGSSDTTHLAKLFCLPPEIRDSGKLSDTFEWMETELTNVVARARTTDMVAKIFTNHLTKSFPCHR